MQNYLRTNEYYLNIKLFKDLQFKITLMLLTLLIL